MKHDIIIVGGGIVGLTLALALAQQTSLSIAILEANKHEIEVDKNNYHHRVSAISLASERIFTALSVWDEIKDIRISPFTHMHVWDGETNAEIFFANNEIAEQHLGAIIENNIIQAALFEKIKQYPQIDLLSPIKLIEYHHNNSHVELIADNGDSFQANLVIAADGTQSWLRSQTKIKLAKENYAQEAIVATVQTEAEHKKTARQVFLATGPLAFLPLKDPCVSSIVWTLPADVANEIKRLNDDEFNRALATAFDQRLGAVVSSGKRYAFPLHRQQADQYVIPRVALVGDAAHTVHPLAGQGVNIGLLDAACLAEVISTAINKRRDFSSLATLRRYERWRRADNLPMLAGIDMLKKLFASEKKTLRDLRAFGLNTTNRIQWIKNIFIQHAVGNRSNLPKLADKKF